MKSIWHGLGLSLCVALWGGLAPGCSVSGDETESGLQAASLSTFTTQQAIAAGNYHSLLLRADGTVWAWGMNTNGQLGDGTSLNRSTAVQVTSLPPIHSIAAGATHSLAVDQDGKVWAWGLNTSGQLGNGTTTSSPVPVSVTIPGGATVVAGGLSHSLALSADGRVWAWGLNTSGQLGNNTTASSSVPVSSVAIPGGAIDVAAGWYHSMALGADGKVWVWGRNANGQVGNGSTTDQMTPTALNLGAPVTAIAAGGFHSMALLSSGAVLVWGYNASGQLGDGTSVMNRLSPVQVPNLSNITSIAAGGYYSLAVGSTGQAWAWGQNNKGQLGNGSVAGSNIPVALPGLTDVQAVAGGYLHTLALRPGCPLWAWGFNGSGQLGDGTTTDHLTPTQAQVFNTFYWDGDMDGFGDPEPGLSTQGCWPDPGFSDNHEDCNDFDPTINPQMPEVCNSVDDNCSGTVDEGFTKSTYYRDADGDSYGTSGSTTQACSNPSGFSSVPGDCNDNNSSIRPGAPETCNGVDDNCSGTVDEGVKTTYCRDADGDGYGTSGSTTQACSRPSGYSSVCGDCNDGNASIRPGASETCNNVDDNCSGVVDEGFTKYTYYRDADGDGYGKTSTQACTQPSGYVSVSGDCNDNNASIKPGATEVCNGVDDNCSGLIDEGVKTTYYRDADGDGWGTTSPTMQACSTPSGYSSSSRDCDDSNASVNPYAIEVCGNDVDDNCDGIFALCPSTCGNDSCDAGENPFNCPRDCVYW